MKLKLVLLVICLLPKSVLCESLIPSGAYATSAPRIPAALLIDPAPTPLPDTLPEVIRKTAARAVPKALAGSTPPTGSTPLEKYLSKRARFFDALSHELDVEATKRQIETLSQQDTQLALMLGGLMAPYDQAQDSAFLELLAISPDNVVLELSSYCHRKRNDGAKYPRAGALITPYLGSVVISNATFSDVLQVSSLPQLLSGRSVSDLKDVFFALERDRYFLKTANHPDFPLGALEFAMWKAQLGVVLNTVEVRETHRPYLWPYTSERTEQNTETAVVFLAMDPSQDSALLSQLDAVSRRTRWKLFLNLVSFGLADAFNVQQAHEYGGRFFLDEVFMDSALAVASWIESLDADLSRPVDGEAARQARIAELNAVIALLQDPANDDFTEVPAVEEIVEAGITRYQEAICRLSGVCH